ncbi:hypothetical protein [Microbacterium kyungheense]|nr:hypothetical protein [Microbacterium kyungheense]
MITSTRHHRTERPSGASVVTAVVEIAGARHEVLPPRQIFAAGLVPQPPRRAEPP